MYGKSLKNLNTKAYVKKKKFLKYHLRNICTQPEFSYKKIEVLTPQKLCINERNFYIYIDKGNFKLKNKIYNTSKFIYSRSVLNFLVDKNVSFYIFFFRKLTKPKISFYKNSIKSKVFLKSYKIKKKYWGTIIDLVNEKDGAIKIIHMKRNKQSSMEFHINKKENYFIDHGELDLGLRYSRGFNSIVKLKENYTFLMKPGTIHMRMAQKDTKIVEISNRDFDDDSIIVHDGKNYKFKVGRS